MLKRMKKYEYKLLTISTSHLSKTKFQIELEEKFRIWGEEGWDLIKMEPISGGGFSFWAETTKFFVVFKREKL